MTNHRYHAYPVDGQDTDSQLFWACGIDQAMLPLWFAEVVDLDEAAKAALYYLVTYDEMTMADALASYEDISPFAGTSGEYIENYLNDAIFSDSTPQVVRDYFDGDLYTADMLAAGELVEFTLGSARWVVHQ